MKTKRSFVIVILALVLTLIIPTTIAFADPSPVRQHFTALECVYMNTPPTMKVSGNTLHMTGQVNKNDVMSDDPSVFPDATNTAILDIFVNTIAMKANYTADAVIEIPDAMGTWEGKGVGHIDLLTGELTGLGIFHGTGEFAGQTLWMKLTNGDISQCDLGAFDASHWDAYIIAP